MLFGSRSKCSWQIVWITGASQGIGRALAVALAKEGVNVAASARSINKLNELVADTCHLPGEIKVFPVDVTDRVAVSSVIEHIESSWGPIDIAVLNAGTFIPMDSAHFDCDVIQRQLDLNVMGVCHGIEPLVQRFVERQKGHIAINASLAGYRGLPRSGGYGASKAALINLAESMWLELKAHHIKVQVINPGFIKTPLTDKNTFPMPFLMDCDKAAAVLVRGLRSSAFEIRFPLLFGLILGFLKHLPYSLYFKLVSRL